MTFNEELMQLDPSMEKLMWSCKSDGVIVSEEGLKELWNAAKDRVLEIFGHQETMSKKLKEMLSAQVFDNLDQDKLVKAVLPTDLAMAVSALQTTNVLLSKLRGGEVIDLSEYIGKDFEDVGIEYREDGMVHMDKFKTGNWGAGKGKSNVSSPLEFKKTVEEVNWGANGKQIAQELVKEIDIVSKAKMLSSINLHYQTLVRAVYSKQEKSDVRANKQIIVKQIKNMIAVRNTLIKFAYTQLKRVAKAYIPPTEEETEPDDNSSSENDE